MKTKTTSIRLQQLCTILLFLLCFRAAGQHEGSLQLRDSLAVTGQYLTVDALGNLYVISGNVFSRYDAGGKLLYTHSNLADGNFTSADVADPLKIVLFSKEFGRIRYLDNTLTTRGDVISLAELGFVNTSLVCTSFENGLWIYDPVSIQLVRFNTNLQAFDFSGNIAQLAGRAIHPNFLTEHNNLVYLCDSAAGILIFDRYGAYLKTLPFKGGKTMQVSGETLCIFSGTEMLLYNTRSHQEKILPIPVKNGISAVLFRSDLYLLTREKILVFKAE
jgi:hypothetical protein